ncbi:MAG TPA: hypothetical protein PK919_04600 [Candidatus Aminicenantes bacterium]|nr:hypothetical protein [Candidatus Aminicenantes bacterium]
MDIKERAREQLNGLERVLLKIPGFKGYFERELRRDSDRLQREYVVKQLRRVKTGMNKSLQAASRAKDFERLRECEGFVRQLDKTIAAVRYADPGYSGFFDLVKIREAELDRVYECDARLAEAAAALAAAPLDAADLAPLHAGLAGIEELFAQRLALLKGWAGGGER